MLTRFFFCLLLILSFFIAINMRSQVPITIKKKNFSNRISNPTTMMPLPLSNWFKLAICITVFFIHSKQRRRIVFILWKKKTEYEILLVLFLKENKELYVKISLLTCNGNQSSVVTSGKMETDPVENLLR